MKNIPIIILIPLTFTVFIIGYLYQTIISSFKAGIKKRNKHLNNVGLQ
jgi:hypothetical protein